MITFKNLNINVCDLDYHTCVELTHAVLHRMEQLSGGTPFGLKKTEPDALQHSPGEFDECMSS